METPTVLPIAPNPSDFPADRIKRAWTLPSGKEVVFLKGKGRDLRTALMAAGKNADQFKILYAIIAQLARIDGKRITMEAMDEMDLDDVLELQLEAGKAMGGKQKAPEAEVPEENLEPTTDQ